MFVTANNVLDIYLETEPDYLDQIMADLRGRLNVSDLVARRLALDAFGRTDGAAQIVSWQIEQVSAHVSLIVYRGFETAAEVEARRFTKIALLLLHDAAHAPDAVRDKSRLRVALTRGPLAVVLRSALSSSELAGEIGSEFN